jgi:hypothetical protein
MGSPVKDFFARFSRSFSLPPPTIEERPPIQIGSRAFVDPRTIAYYEQFLDQTPRNFETPAVDWNEKYQILCNCFSDIEDIDGFLTHLLPPAKGEILGRLGPLYSRFDVNALTVRLLKRFYDFKSTMEIPRIVFPDFPPQFSIEAIMTAMIEGGTIDRKIPAIVNGFLPPIRSFGCFVPPEVLAANPDDLVLPNHRVFPQGIAANGDFVVVLMDNGEVRVFPLLNGCVVLSPFSVSIPGIEVTRLTSISLIGDRLRIEGLAGHRRAEVSFSEIKGRRVESVRFFQSEMVPLILCSDGCTEMVLSRQSLKIDERNSVTLGRGSVPFSGLCYQVLPDIETIDVNFETNGAFLLVRADVDGRVLWRSFSALMGDFVCDYETDPEEDGNVAASAYDSLNGCHWIVSRRGESLVLKCCIAEASVNPYLFGFSSSSYYSPPLEQIQARLLSLIGLSHIPPCYHIEWDRYKVQLGTSTVSDSVFWVFYLVGLLNESVYWPQADVAFEELLLWASMCKKRYIHDFQMLHLLEIGIRFRSVLHRASETWTTVYLATCCPAASDEHQVFWAQRRIEDGLFGLPLDIPLVFPGEFPETYPGAGDFPCIALVLSLQTALALRCLLDVEQTPYASLDIRPCCDTLRTIDTVMTEFAAKWSSDLAGLRRSKPTVPTLIASEPGLLILSQFIGLIPAISHIGRLIQIVLHIIGPVSFQLIGAAAQCTEQIPEPCRALCAALRYYMPFVVTQTSATAVQGGGFTEFERQYNWIISPNIDGVALAHRRESFVDDRISPDVMAQVYANWNPSWHRGLRDDLKELDRWTLSVAISQLHCESDFAAFLRDKSTVSDSLKAALRFMRQIRANARQESQRGEEATSRLENLRFLYCCNSDFAAGWDPEQRTRDMKDFVEHGKCEDVSQTIVHQPNRIELATKGHWFLQDALKHGSSVDVSKVQWFAVSQIPDFHALGLVCRSCPEKASRIHDSIRSCFGFLERSIPATLQHLEESGMFIFFDRLIQECGTGSDNAKILEQFIRYISHESIFVLCAVLARKCDSIPESLLNLEQLKESETEVSRRQVILLSLFGMTRKMNLSGVLNIYEMLASFEQLRCIFGFAVSRQLAMDSPDREDLLTPVFERLGEKVLNCAFDGDVSEWIWMIRRGMRMSPSLSAFVCAAHSPTARVFTYAVCGLSFESVLSSSKIGAGARQYRRFGHDHCCELPVTFETHVELWNTGWRASIIPDVEMPLVNLPDDFAAVLQSGVDSLSSPFSYVTAASFPSSSFPFSDIRVDWSSVFLPFDMERGLANLKEITGLPEVRSIQNCIVLRFDGDHVRVGAAPSRFVVITDPIVNDTSFTIAGLQRFFIWIIPNTYGSVTLLNRLFWIRFVGNDPRHVHIDTDNCCLQIDGSSYDFPACSCGYRCVIVCDDSVDDLRITDLAASPDLFCPLQEPIGDEPLHPDPSEPHLVDDEPICLFDSPFDFAKASGVCSRGKQIIQGHIREELARGLLTLRFGKQVMAFDAFPGMNLVALYRVLAVNAEFFDYQKLVSGRFPLELTIRADDIFAKEVMPRFWRIEGFDAELHDYIERIYCDLAFHLFQRHRSAIFASRSQYIHDQFAHGFLLFDARFNQFETRKEVRVNGIYVDLPHVVLGDELDLDLRYAIGSVIVVPFSQSSHTWMFDSVFELAIMIKHLYLKSDSPKDWGFAETAYLASVALGSPAFISILLPLYALFTAQHRPGDYPDDFPGFLHFASHVPALADFIAGEQRRYDEFSSDLNLFFRSPGTRSCVTTVTPIPLFGRSDVTDFPAAVRDVCLILQSFQTSGPFPFPNMLPFWVGISNPEPEPVTIDLRTLHGDLIAATTFLSTEWSAEKTENLHSAIATNGVAIAEIAEALDLGPASAVLLMTSLINRATFLFTHDTELLNFSEVDIDTLFPFIAPIARTQAILSAIYVSGGRHSEYDYWDRRSRSLRISRDIPAISQISEFLLSHDDARFSPRPWHVTFRGEDAIDAGGPSNELFEMVAESIFEEGTHLVRQVWNHEFMPLETADRNLLQAVGAFVVVCLRANHTVALPLCDLVWRFMCGRSVRETDVARADPTFAAALRAVRASRGAGQRWVGTNWSGAEISLRATDAEVGEAEVEDWAAAAVAARVEEMTPALEAMRTGFEENARVGEMHKIMRPEQIREMVEGRPEIDVPSLREAVLWEGGSGRQFQKIQAWFWDCVRDMDQKDRSHLLRFGTARSRMPTGGRSRAEFHMRVTIYLHRVDQLPEAHTCFSQLVLWDYTTFEIMKARILTAIRECGTMEMA